MTFLVVILSYFVVQIFSNDCCQLHTDDGQLIDLSSYRGKVWDFKYEHEKGHHFTVSLCGNLPQKYHCVHPTETTGPSPMKDEYTSAAVNSACYYIGGMDKCTFDTYNKKSKTSLITLPGVPDKNKITRSLEVTVHCINDPIRTEFACGRVRRDTVDHFTYECDFYSEYGCPNYKPNPIGALSVVVVFLFLSCCVCGAVVLSIAVIVAFVMVKGRTPSLYNRDYDTYKPISNKDDLKELSTSNYQAKNQDFKGKIPNFEEEKDPIKVKRKKKKKKSKKKRGKEKEKKLVKDKEENASEVIEDKESKENTENVKDMD